MTNILTKLVKQYVNVRRLAKAVVDISNIIKNAKNIKYFH